MSRRGLIAAVGGWTMVVVALLSLALPTAARDKVWSVGLLDDGPSPTQTAVGRSSWRDGVLRSLERNVDQPGRELKLVDRYSDGHVDRLPGLAREIAAANVDVIIVIGEASMRAMLAASRTTPIVMVVGADPVAAGFIASLARSGGRVSGLALQTNEGDVKRLQLLREAMPAARRFGLLRPAGQDSGPLAGLMTGAARKLDIELTQRAVARLEETDYRSALVAMRSQGVAGVVIAASGAWAVDAPWVGRIAQSLGLPAICEWAYMARDGCAFAYGHDLAYVQRRAGEYAARILRGAAPAELPVEQPDVWKFSVNLLATARLGLTVPPALLARADEAIE